MNDVKTDWAKRSKTYNNIKWVNNDETLNSIIDFCGNINEKKILDLGTGTGKVLRTLKAHFPSGEFYGIDISEEMMSKIEDKEDFNLIVGKIEELKVFEDNTFDVLTARMVFHHSENVEMAMSEAYRILKPNGRFIVCEGTPPNKECVEFYKRMFKYKEERHTFLVDDITNLMINSNFEDITSKTIVSKNMSLNNWIDNSGIPEENIKIIKRMHYEAYENEILRKSYAMEKYDNDICMNWKFTVTCAIK